MHQYIDNNAQEWLEGRRRDASPYSGFFHSWTVLNILYNFHCYDMHPRCSLCRQLAFDLQPRSLGTQPSNQKQMCGCGNNYKKERISEWALLTCTVRFIPDEEICRIMAHPSVLYFASRNAYSPRTGNHDVPNSGVLDIRKTKFNPNQPPFYTLGFVHAWNEYQNQKYTPSDMIQHLARLLYTIRCNLYHGGKYYSRATNREVIERSVPLLREIVFALIETPPDRFSSEI